MIGTVRTILSRGLPLGVAIAAVAACDTGRAAEDAADLDVVVERVNGTTRVLNRGTPPRWNLRMLTAISSEEFGRIVGVIADAAGNLYVADEFANIIFVFDAEGRRLGTIGGAGEGPGEFRRLISIGWLGDRIAALDAGHGRLGLFSTDGEWLGQRPFMAYAGVHLLPTGPEELYMPFIRVAGDDVRNVFVRQLPAGVADTIASPADPRGDALRVTCHYAGGALGIATYEVARAPILLAAPAPDRLRAEVWTADYRIAFVSPAGDTVRIVERDLPRIRWSGDEWRLEEETFDEFVRQYPGTTCEPRRLPRPDAKSRVRALGFDDASRLWVEWMDDVGNRHLDLFDSEGRLLADLLVTGRTERVPPFIRDGRLYVVGADRWGSQQVMVFEMEPPEPAAEAADPGEAA